LHTQNAKVGRERLLAALELHLFLHRVPKIDTPTHVVFNLDPGEGANIFNCAEIAFVLRDVFTILRSGFRTQIGATESGSLCRPIKS
jgi:hypothetical protein